MYLAFQPRNSFQGLPPLKDEVCVSWVQDMLRTGIHVDGAVRRRRRIVGHTALFPINRQKCEMLVVVCPGFQNVGIGTELVRSCIDLADELGFQRIWLPVDATNVRARHVYRKCGFEYVPRAGPRAGHGVRGPPPPLAAGLATPRFPSSHVPAAAISRFP